MHSAIKEPVNREIIQQVILKDKPTAPMKPRHADSFALVKARQQATV